MITCGQVPPTSLHISSVLFLPGLGPLVPVPVVNLSVFLTLPRLPEMAQHSLTLVLATALTIAWFG